MNHLQLEDYFLERLNVEFEFPDEGELDITALVLHSGFDYEIFRHPEHNLRRLMRLDVSLKGMTRDHIPAGLQIECVINGEFTIPENEPEERREGLLRINGVSMLYSTLRGILGSVTGAYPGGKLCLPSIMPNDIVKEIEEKKAKRALKRSKKGRSLEL